MVVVANLSLRPTEVLLSAHHDGRMTEKADVQAIELKDAVRFALEEARMLQPGIQALFGFQLIAAFNERFEDLLGHGGQTLHLVALLLVALACALVMTPAACHRAMGRRKVSRHLLKVSSRFIGWSMVPLMLAIAIDIGLVTYAVMESTAVATAVGGASALVFAALWLVYPRIARPTEELSEPEARGS